MYQGSPLPNISSFTGLLDTYPGAALAYSFRKLRAAYAGSAVRIRRSSDNAEQDIGFSGNDFDTTAAATHIGGGSGFIVTWYDQSANGLDVTQSTAGSQLAYSATGGPNSKPAIDGNNGLYLNRTFDVSAYVTSQPTVMIVLFTDGGGANECPFSWIDQFGCFSGFGSQIYWDVGSDSAGRVNFGWPGSWVGNNHILEMYRDSGNTQGITVDGSSLGTGSKSQAIPSLSQLFSIGAYGSGFNCWIGLISEFVVWGTDLGGTNRTGARTNMNTYYTVF